MRTHILCVEIEVQVAAGRHEAHRHLKNWIETFGHTSSLHGFKFINVSTTARKTRTRPHTRQSKESKL